MVLEPSVGLRVTASDNAGLGLSSSGRDIVLDGIARLRVNAEGARLSLIGTASVESVVYTRHTQSDEIVPRVDLTGRWLAIERFLFIEAAARTEQTLFDPFGPTLTSTTTGNNTTATQYRFTPYIDSEVAPNLHFRARSDTIETREYGVGSEIVDPLDTSNLSQFTASLERDPRPLGWRLEAERSSTRYEGELVPLVTEIARGLVNVAVNETTRVGLRYGAERNNFLADPGWTPVYGGQLGWRPSERTTLALEAEHRFFGTAGHLTFSHRMPFFAWDLRAGRDLQTTPHALFSLPPTDNVAGLLDAILTTRVPNAIERARQVQDIIARQGLPATTATGIALLGQRLSITESASMSLAFLGVRNSLALTVFATESQDALEDGPLATGNVDTNNKQYGTTLAYSLRMTPNTSAGLTLDYRRIQSLDTALTFERTTESSARAYLLTELAPKTTGLLGAQYRKLASNVNPGGREASAYVALDHKF